LIIRKNAQKNHDEFRLVENRLLVCSTKSANPAYVLSTVDRRTLQKAPRSCNVFSALPRYLSRFAEQENWAI
jgi:hypothetical protein